MSDQHIPPDALQDFFDSGICGCHIVGPDGTILAANPADYEPLGYTREEYVGRNITEFHADAHTIADILATLTRGDELRNREARLRCKDGSVRTVLIQSSVRRGSRGEFISTRCFTFDITEYRRLIEAQALALAELSTPLIQVADDILMMPLVGVVDSARAEQIVSTLLTGVHSTQARFLILDITGVRTVDTAVIDVMLKAATAVRLLGAEPILTGVSSHVARTIVGLGVDVSSIVTLQNLARGIAWAQWECARRRA